MANRVLQAKMLKEKKRKRKLPRYLRMDVVKVSHFNPNAPGSEVFRRKFDPPDAATMEKDVSKTISYFGAEVVGDVAIITDGFVDKGTPKEFSSQAHAKAWLDKVPTTKRPAMTPDPLARPEFYEPDTSSELKMGKLDVQTVHSSKDMEHTIVKSHLENTMYTEWRNWRRQGKTYFVRQQYDNRNGQDWSIWFYGQKVYVVMVNETHVHFSPNYFTIEHALRKLKYHDVRWVEVIQIKSS